MSSTYGPDRGIRRVNGEMGSCFSCPVSPLSPDAPRCVYEVWDKALGMLLEHEEHLLGELVGQYNDLVHMARQQAEEMSNYLDDES